MGTIFTQFEEGIEKTVKWYIENKSWLNNILTGKYKNYNGSK